MTNNNIQDKYTSLPLAQKIAEGGFKEKSEKFYTKDSMDETKPYINKPFDGNPRQWVKSDLHCYDIMNDLCIRYRKEFFGEENLNEDGETDKYFAKMNWCKDGYTWSLAYIYHTREILELMQKGLKQEAEDYIIKHSILFNKENKGK